MTDQLPLDDEQKHRAAKIRAEIAEKQRPIHVKALEWLKSANLQKGLIAIALIGLGVAATKLWDNDAFNTRFDVTKPRIVDPVVIATPPPVIPLEAEVFLTEEGATDAERELVTQHADARDANARIVELEQKLAAVVETVNGMAATGLASGGLTERQVNTLAREQIEYYKRNEDAIAKRKGWKNYITWGEIVKFRR